MVNTRSSHRQEPTAGNFELPPPQATISHQRLEDDLARLASFVPTELTAFTSTPALSVSRAQARRNLAQTAFAKRVREGRGPANEEELVKEVRELRRLPIPTVRSRPGTTYLDAILTQPSSPPRTSYRAPSPPTSNLRTTNDRRSFQELAASVRNAATKLSSEEVTAIEAREAATRKEKTRGKGFVMEIVDTSTALAEQPVLSRTRSGKTRAGESGSPQTLHSGTASSRASTHKRGYSEVDIDTKQQAVSDSTQDSAIAKRRELAKPVNNESTKAEQNNTTTAADGDSQSTNTIKLKFRKLGTFEASKEKAQKDDHHLHEETMSTIENAGAKELDAEEPPKGAIMLKFKLSNNNLLIPTNPFSNSSSTISHPSSAAVTHAAVPQSVSHHMTDDGQEKTTDLPDSDTIEVAIPSGSTIRRCHRRNA